MTHYMKPEGDDRPGYAHGDSARATAFDDETLIDHHIEEMLGALSDLQVLRLHAPVE